MTPVYVHLYWRFSSASRTPSVPENEADNPEMITTFQLGGDAVNVRPPTFLRARDLILSQFSIDCCENAFASDGPPNAPRPSAGKFGSQTLILTPKMNPPPFQILATGLTCAITNTQCCQSVIRNLVDKFVGRLDTSNKYHCESVTLPKHCILFKSRPTFPLEGAALCSWRVVYYEKTSVVSLLAQ